MHIRKLDMEHFRGASKCSIELGENLNVFVGVNGAGKSSVLDAVAILLSWLVNRINSPRASGRPITEPDIENGEPKASLGISCDSEGATFEWRARKGRRGNGASSDLASASKFAEEIRCAIMEGEGRANVPLFAYYPVNRAVLDIPLRIRKRHSFDLLSAYDESLSGGANFRIFFEWFREREDIENEALRDAKAQGSLSPKGVSDPQLEAVRKSLAEFMPGFSAPTVRRDPLRMEVKKQGKVLTVNQLSDGEKCLMAMVGDLARRLAIANPLRDNPLEGEGVVLIDEIDLHLHPKWQRMVVPRLRDVFPRCQFIVSTHSPHVITHVQPEELFLLKMTGNGMEVQRAEESYGKTANRVLEDVMELETTRPKDVADDLRQIYGLIDGGSTDDALESIDDLERRIGADPDLVKARVLIERRELIGK